MIFVLRRKWSIVLRTQLSVRVHACIDKLLNSDGRELRRSLFSLKQIFQVKQIIFKVLVDFKIVNFDFLG